jgi:hypothetical protein
MTTFANNFANNPYVAFQLGIIDAFNHQLAHVHNDLTIQHGIIITSYYSLLNRIRTAPEYPQLSCDNADVNRYIRLYPYDYRRRVYCTSYGDIIAINNDLSILVLGKPVVNDTTSDLITSVRRFECVIANRTIDIVMQCFIDLFITADMEMPGLYEIREAYSDLVTNPDEYIKGSPYDIGYSAGAEFIENTL